MNNEYTVIVKNGSSPNSSPENSVDKVDAGTDLEQAKTKNKEVSFAVGEMAQLLISASNEVVTWGYYEINKNLNLTDDYIGQRNLQVAQTLIGKTSSIVTSMVSGALAGAAVGGPFAPVFAAVGAVTAGVTGIVHEVLETSRSYEQQDIQLRQMQAQLDYTRQRAGWSTQAASIGEDL